MTAVEQLHLLTVQLQHHTIDPLNAVLLADTLGLPGPLDWKLQFYQWYAPIIISLHLNQVSELLIIFFLPVLLFITLVIFIYCVFRVMSAFSPSVFKLFGKKTPPYTFLKVTFPNDTAKSAFATEQLFIQLHTLGRQLSFFEKITKYKKTYSLEIVASKKEGICYHIYIPSSETDIFKRNFIAYLPGITVHEQPDYLLSFEEKTRVFGIAELKLSGHNALPLQKNKLLTEHDPLSFLTGNMTKLQDSELVAYQIVTTPVLKSHHGSFMAETNKLIRAMYVGEPITPLLSNSSFTSLKAFPLFSVLFFILESIIYIFMGILELVLSIIKIVVSDQSTSASLMMSQPGVIPQEILNPYEQELTKVVKEKIDQNLFESSIRLLVVGKDSDQINSRLSGLTSAFGSMTSTYQSLVLKSTFLPSSIVLRKRLAQFKKRLLSPNQLINENPILSASELSDLYHFPTTYANQTEDMVKILAKELPPPLSIKRTENHDMSFAKNTYGGKVTEIGLSREDRRRHMVIFGQTGSGKSTLLQTMINQDIKNGKGLCIIDPHGQLADETLGSIVQAQRGEDLIWFNPDDLKQLIAVNIMELTPGLSTYESLREKEFICESIISLFRKVFSDSLAANPHRIESILRNTIHTAFFVEDATLFTIYDLLTDPTFRSQTVAKVTDVRLQKFWKNLFGKAGNWQQVKMIAPVTSRIERFLFSPSMKGILGHNHSTINFDEIMDQEKLLICNLSKGKLGEDTSQVLGLLILTKIQLTTLKRARFPEQERRDFYLYVDEFQNFATLSFVQMLSEARKYRLNIIIAEQTTAQQKDTQITQMLFANAATVVSFKTATPVDEDLLLPLFAPVVTKGEIHNLPAFHFYIKLGALHPEEPFSAVTIPQNIPQDTKKIEQMITHSNSKYTVTETEFTVPVLEQRRTKIQIKKQTTRSKRQKRVGLLELKNV